MSNVEREDLAEVLPMAGRYQLKMWIEVLGLPRARWWQTKRSLRKRIDAFLLRSL